MEVDSVEELSRLHNTTNVSQDLVTNEGLLQDHHLAQRQEVEVPHEINLQETNPHETNPHETNPQEINHQETKNLQGEVSRQALPVEEVGLQREILKVLKIKVHHPRARESQVLMIVQMVLLMDQNSSKHCDFMN